MSFWVFMLTPSLLNITSGCNAINTSRSQFKVMSVEMPSTESRRKHEGFSAQKNCLKNYIAKASDMEPGGKMETAV